MSLAILALAALAIWGLRSFEQARRRRMELLANERRRIAQSLHDSTLQDIFGALLLARNLATRTPGKGEEPRGEQIAGLLASATESLRRSIDLNGERQEVDDLSSAIHELRPPAALAQPVAIDISEAGRAWPIAKHRAHCILQIVSEAVNNAAKHASAKDIAVRLDWSLATLRIEVSDNGTGFDPAHPNHRNGFGLSGMETMADAAKLRFAIQSRPGEGTRVTIKVPRFVL